MIAIGYSGGRARGLGCIWKRPDSPARWWLRVPPLASTRKELLRGDSDRDRASANDTCVFCHKFLTLGSDIVHAKSTDNSHSCVFCHESHNHASSGAKQHWRLLRVRKPEEVVGAKIPFLFNLNKKEILTPLIISGFMPPKLSLTLWKPATTDYRLIDKKTRETDQIRIKTNFVLARFSIDY